jgi:hypothetical protein
MEVIKMTRLIKFLTVTGLSSVYLMQIPCTTSSHGFSMIPNGIIPNPFAGLTAPIASLLAGLGIGT